MSGGKNEKFVKYRVSVKATSQTAAPQSVSLPFPAATAIMTDALAEQNLKLVQDRELNGEAEIREEADPVEEAAKKKKKKKKKGKSATTGEQCWAEFMLTG